MRTLKKVITDALLEKRIKERVIRKTLIQEEENLRVQLAQKERQDGEFLKELDKARQNLQAMMSTSSEFGGYIESLFRDANEIVVLKLFVRMAIDGMCGEDSEYPVYIYVYLQKDLNLRLKKTGTGFSGGIHGIGFTDIARSLQCEVSGFVSKLQKPKETACFFFNDFVLVDNDR